MVLKRAQHIRRILAKDPAFTNVLVGILMVFFESLWVVVLYDSGWMVMGVNFGRDLQLISSGLLIFMTTPYLLASLFLASSMTDVARHIVKTCSGLIAVLAVVFAVGMFLEFREAVHWGLVSMRSPYCLFGIFVVMRIPMLRVKIVQIQT